MHHSIIFLCSMLMTLMVDAATFLPTSTLELIDAINAANINAEDDTIDLGGNTFSIAAVNHTTLTGPTGLPALTSDSGHTLSIRNGTIERNLTEGTPAFRLMRILVGATVNLENIEFKNGLAEAFNGGAILNSGTLSVDKSSFENNHALNGGGIFNFNTIASIRNSTFLSNNVDSGGGALLNFGVIHEISNSTFYGNDSLVQGGAIGNDFGTIVILANSTITNNTAVFSGGGIANDFGTISNLTSTIVAQNSASSGADIFNESSFSNGVIEDESFNLIGDNDASGIVAGFPNSKQSIVGSPFATIDPLLGPLENNGGFTKTQALLPDSPAIDKGDNPLALAYDQRGEGFVRVAQAQTDIGAYEVPPPPGPETICDDGIDNDGNGGFDCGDENCRYFAACGLPPLITIPTTLAQLITALDNANSNRRDDIIDLSGATFTLVDVNNTSSGPNGLPLIGPDKSSGASHNILIRNGVIQRSTTQGTPPFRLFEVLTGADLNLHAVVIRNGDPGTGQNGGAIFVNPSGTIGLINASTFSANRSEGSGGAIYLDGGIINMIRAANFINNSSTTGGAISTDSRIGLILRSTFSGNSAINGGAIALSSTGRLEAMAISTISSNAATDTGGGIYNLGLLGIIRNNTIVQNVATISGGGIYNGGTIFQITSTIIAKNIGTDAPDIDNLSALGNLVFESFNLIGTNLGSGIPDGQPNANSSLVGTQGSPVDPLLGPLANNGGNTNTHALLAGSPAIDNGSNPQPLLPLDQRGPGFFRTINGRTDIGAVEKQTP